jgi:hypothetical protein
MSDEPYAVVLNDLARDLDDSVELGAGWVLERPTEVQIQKFRPVLRSLYNATSLFPDQPPPHEARKTGDDKALTMAWDLPAGEWRYRTVRRVDAAGLGADSLVQALSLPEVDLFVDYWPNGEPPRTDGRERRIMSPSAMTTFFHDRLSIDVMPEAVSIEEVREIVGLRAKLDGSKHGEIARMLALYVETAVLPIRSNQTFLAYFGVIEGLLTHQPSPGDENDSISRQLKRNLLAIDDRLPDRRGLEFGSFGGAEAEKVISTLYGYRSAVAHGGSPDKHLKFFRKRWDSVLVQLELHRYARRMVKRVLVGALREPKLITSLKTRRV